MSSADIVTEPQTSKTEPKRGRRVLLAAVVFVGAFVVLITGVMLMQEENRNLRGTVAEFKTLPGNFVLI